MSSTKSWFNHQLSEWQYERFARASESHESARADRNALGPTPSDPTGRHLAAVDEADAALTITGQALDAILVDYLQEPVLLPVR